MTEPFLALTTLVWLFACVDMTVNDRVKQILRRVAAAHHRAAIKAVDPSANFSVFTYCKARGHMLGKATSVFRYKAANMTAGVI